MLSMINEQYDRAKALLLEHKEGHNRLAELLLEREVIFAEDVETIFGKRPWVSRSEEIMEEENKGAHDGSDDNAEPADDGAEPTPSTVADGLTGTKTGEEDIQKA